MGRVIVGVIVGFVVTVVITLAGFAAGYFGLGLDWILEPGSYDATLRWSIIGVTIGLVGAIVGGLTCSLIARRSLAVKCLAAAFLVLGGLHAASVLFSAPADHGPRPADEPADVTREKLSEPTWVAITNPIVGFVGVIIGGSLLRPRQKPSA